MGRRIVTVTESDFPHHDHHPNGYWYLFCVQVVQKQPQQSHHHAANTNNKQFQQDVYYKFVVSPTNRMNGMLKHGGLVLRRHCILLDLHAHMARMRTNVLYRERRQRLQQPALSIRFHFHVGLVLDVLRTSLDTPQAIHEYQLACYRAIDDCEDEAELDEWIDRARLVSSTLPGNCRSRFQPPKLSDTIPELIVVDHGACQLEFTAERHCPDQVWMEDATRDAVATARG